MPYPTRPMAGRPLPRNVRAFLAFRVLFNARFYYPVLAVFFVDLGLTLDRYALLNVAWAASHSLWRVRRAMMRLPDDDPPRRLEDFVRHSLGLPRRD